MEFQRLHDYCNDEALIMIICSLDKKKTYLA